MNNFLNIIILMLMLLNPFLLIVYLSDIMKKNSDAFFIRLLLTAGFISFIVFSLFATIGDYIFETILQTEVASFQIFGGIVFIMIALKFVFHGEAAIEALRADSKNVASSVAMPIMIGPGTIGISILAGKQLELSHAITAIFISLTVSISVMFILKKIFDFIATKNESLIEQYLSIASKIIALVIGTYSIDMIMKGLLIWIKKIA